MLSGLDCLADDAPSMAIDLCWRANYMLFGGFGLGRSKDCHSYTCTARVWPSLETNGWQFASLEALILSRAANTEKT